MDAAGIIAHYVMDGDRPLTAESAGNHTFYLYGLGTIGEKTNEWNFSLPDGTNTPRQLTDTQAEITLSARYTPWGDSLELHGAGNFTFGYLGGVLDASTGLLYVGNGQYYDPETGRFITRDAKSDNSNPYVPWDPIGAIIGPLGIAALFSMRRKKGSKWGTFLVLLIMLGSSGMTLAGCITPQAIGITPATAPMPITATVSQWNGVITAVVSTPTQVVTVTTPASPITLTLPDCPTPTLTPGLDLFGISFEGSWSSSEHSVVLAAVQKVGEKYAPFLGGLSSDAAFKTAYGTPFSFVKSGGSGGTYCQGGPNKVVCYGNAPLGEDYPVQLLVHELGHALQHSRYNVDTQGPYGSLENARIEDDLGNWVTGKHPTIQEDPTEDPAVDGEFERTSRGYLSELPPHMYHGSGWPDWRSNLDNEARNEDFADMFMNWVFNSFDYRPEANGAGFKRFDWMERNMYAWITG